MSATHDEDENDTRSISIRVENKFLNEFDIALKQAQIEGDVEMGMSRSEAIRQLMRAAKEDMTLLTDADDG
jgi:metal-responsive CopG/Arc/MetJ family transcriptional regulator